MLGCEHEKGDSALHVAAADLGDVGPLGKGLAEGLATLLTLLGGEGGADISAVPSTRRAPFLTSGTLLTTNKMLSLLLSRAWKLDIGLSP